MDGAGESSQGSAMGSPLGREDCGLGELLSQGIEEDLLGVRGKGEDMLIGGSGQWGVRDMPVWVKRKAGCG